MRRRLGEAPKQRHVDGRVELRDRFTRNTKPFGRLVGTAAIQPLGSLEPIAEKQRVFVEAEMLQHKAQRAGGRVLAVENDGGRSWTSPGRGFHRYRRPLQTRHRGRRRWGLAGTPGPGAWL